MTAWRYKNLDDIDSPASILYDFEGKVRWQFKADITPWHGEVRKIAEPGKLIEMVLRCNELGDDRDLKTVLLRPDNLDDRWSGLDYKMSRIELTRISCKQWCNNCYGWH